MDNELKFGDKYFNGMLKLSEVPDWNPLYEFLKHIFGDKYKKAANGFMFMGAYKYEKIDTDFYIYKHGITRKSFVLNDQGEPYELEYKLIKYNNPESKVGHSYDHFIQGASKMSYTDMFNYIYENIVKMVNRACEENDCKIPDDEFLMGYSDYVILREKLLKKHGIKSITINKDDDLNNIKLENNKTKTRLIEMFDKICGVNLIKESIDSSDMNIIIQGYIKGAMDILSGVIKAEDSMYRKSNDSEYAGDEEEIVDNGMDFSQEVSYENIRRLIQDYNRVGLNQFISNFVDCDSMLDIYSDIKKVIEISGSNIIEDVKNSIGLKTFGSYILFSRNDRLSNPFSRIKDGLKIKEATNEIGMVDFSVDRGNLIFFKDGTGSIV